MTQRYDSEKLHNSFWLQATVQLTSVLASSVVACCWRMTLEVKGLTLVAWASACDVYIKVYLSVILGSWSTSSLPPLQPTAIYVELRRFQFTDAIDTLPCSCCAGRLKGFGRRDHWVKKSYHAVLHTAAVDATKSAAHATLFFLQSEVSLEELYELLLHCIRSKMQHGIR